MRVPHKLVKACIKGNQCACKAVKKVAAVFASSIVTFADAESITEHPNRMPFKGVLLRVDEPSDKPPHGSELHRIYVSHSTLDKKLPGLINMAVNYQPGDMASHATRHKVGVIEKAWRKGNDVWVSGIIWGKDFPEAKRDLKQKDLGMSMELSNVMVDDENANIWKLDDFEFTGATILKRGDAAYNRTSLQASKQLKMLLNQTAAAIAAATVEGAQMKKPKDGKDRKKVAAANGNTGPDNGSLALLAQTITAGFEKIGNNIVGEIKASNAQVSEKLEELQTLHVMQASADRDEDMEDDDDTVVLNAGADDEEEDEGDDVAAAAEEDDDDMEARSEDDDDDMEADEDTDDSSDDDSSDDDSSATDMEAMEDLEDGTHDVVPGNVNKGAKNKGKKTTVTDPPKQGEVRPGNVAKGRLAAARGGRMKGNFGKKPFPSLAAAAAELNELSSIVRKQRRTIQAMEEKHATNIKKLRRSLKASNAQVKRFADLEGRRSHMPVELTSLASKAGLDLREMKASGQQMTTAQFDQMIAIASRSGISLPIQQRMGMKNLMVEQGLLADDVVDRGYGRVQ